MAFSPLLRADKAPDAFRRKNFCKLNQLFINFILILRIFSLNLKKMFAQIHSIEEVCQ